MYSSASILLGLAVSCELIDHLPVCSHRDTPASRLLSLKQETGEDQLEEAQRKARGIIRALENVGCDERLKDLVYLSLEWKG